MMRLIDARGLGETRRQVLGEARGRVLDIGTGTGSNLPLFPTAVEELVLAEPDGHMQGVLGRKVREMAPHGAGLRAGQMPVAPRFMKPLVFGSAILPADGSNRPPLV